MVFIWIASIRCELNFNLKGKKRKTTNPPRERKKVIRVACSQQDEKKSGKSETAHTNAHTWKSKRVKERERTRANVFFPFNILSKHYQQLADNSNGRRSIPHTKKIGSLVCIYATSTLHTENSGRRLCRAVPSDNDPAPIIFDAISTWNEIRLRFDFFFCFLSIAIQLNNFGN